MKKNILGIAVFVGLAIGLMAPTANAHRGHSDLSFRLGSAYVYYGGGFHRVDQNYRYGPRNRYGYFTAKRRHIRQSDLWHHCFDGRWYRYHDRSHWRVHDNRRHNHRKRRGHRYRYW